jgi:DNA gyrase/topoisomerase IV subunit A
VCSTLSDPNFQQVIDVLFNAAQTEILLRRICDALGDNLPPVAFLVWILSRYLSQKYQIIQNRETKPLWFCHGA